MITTTHSQIGVILLAGGLGTRMLASTPKQFLPLKEKPIALYSFQLFLEMPEISEIIVVCDPLYRHLFSALKGSAHLTFALPGPRRQDSVFNGLQALQSTTSLICVHDAARPFITREMVQRVLSSAEQHGAAAVGMPIKFTVKQTSENGFVHHTPDRSTIWEIQTPQAAHRSLLEQGFEEAIKNNLTVTDDVSLVELLQYPVKLVEGSHSNLKITTPEDLTVAEHLLEPIAVK